MVQRDDLLPVAFGGVLIGLIMMIALPFNVLAFGAAVTCLLTVFGTIYGNGAIGKVKSVVAPELYAEQIPVGAHIAMRVARADCA